MLGNIKRPFGVKGLLKKVRSLFYYYKTCSLSWKRTLNCIFKKLTFFFRAKLILDETIKRLRKNKKKWNIVFFRSGLSLDKIQSQKKIYKIYWKLLLFWNITKRAAEVLWCILQRLLFLTSIFTHSPASADFPQCILQNRQRFHDKETIYSFHFCLIKLLPTLTLIPYYELNRSFSYVYIPTYCK